MSKRHTLKTALLVLALGAIAPADAVAQGARGGDRREPSVTVDYGVLDQLGPPRTVPGALLEGRDGFDRPSFRPGRSAAEGDETIVIDSSTGRRSTGTAKARKPKSNAAKAAPRQQASIRPSAPTTTTNAPPRNVMDLPLARTEPLSRPTPVAPPPVAPPPVVAAPVVPAPAAPPPVVAAPVVPAPAAPPPAAPPPVTPPPAAAPAPPPPAPVVRAPPPAAAGPQTAALPPAATTADPAPSYRIAFPLNDSAVPDSGKGQIDRAAEALDRDPSLRLQLLAYASGDAEGASQSRRLSLARALAVRSYLIEKGVRSTRIDVRALGNRAEGGPPDRVDVVILNR